MTKAKWPHTKLGKLQRLILKKIYEIDLGKPQSPIIDMEDLSYAVAKEYAREERFGYTAQGREDAPLGLPHGLEQKYIDIFHSHRRARIFRASLKHSLNSLEARGLIKIHKGRAHRGKRIGNTLVLTEEGKKHIKI